MIGVRGEGVARSTTAAGGEAGGNGGGDDNGLKDLLFLPLSSSKVRCQ